MGLMRFGGLDRELLCTTQWCYRMERNAENEKEVQKEKPRKICEHGRRNDCRRECTGRRILCAQETEAYLRGTWWEWTIRKGLGCETIENTNPNTKDLFLNDPKALNCYKTKETAVAVHLKEKFPLMLQEESQSIGHG